MMNNCPKCGGALFIKFEHITHEWDDEELKEGRITCTECPLRWEFTRVKDAERDENE